MRESKAELTDRLRSEGRWDAFVRRREEIKADGTPAGEAWGIAAAEFAPVTKAAGPVNNGDGNGGKPDLSALRGKSPVPTLDAVRWAFEHLDADWIAPEQAPSAGAWSMRDWARSNAATRAQFYGTFVPRLLPSRAEIDAPAPSPDDPLGDAAECEAGIRLVERLAAVAIKAASQPGPDGLPSEVDVKEIDIEKLLAECEDATGIEPGDGTETADARSA